jgi:hypothetical protein
MLQLMGWNNDITHDPLRVCSTNELHVSDIERT